MKWLRDNLGLISESKQVGELAENVSSSDGVYFVPAFSGLFAPHWRDDARGTLVGMTLHTTKGLQDFCLKLNLILRTHLPCDFGSSFLSN